jgi:hypothetical protein
MQTISNIAARSHPDALAALEELLKDAEPRLSEDPGTLTQSGDTKRRRPTALAGLASHARAWL